MGVAEPSLGADKDEQPDGDVSADGKRACPPDDWVADQINLPMVLDPEVLRRANDRVSKGSNAIDISRKTHDTATHERPGRRPRIVRMPVRQTGVCVPHDGLKLKELGKEARLDVVDLLGRERHCESASKKGISQRQAGSLEWMLGARSGCVLVSMYHRLLSSVGFLLHVTSCCSKPQSGSLILCEKR